MSSLRPCTFYYQESTMTAKQERQTILVVDDAPENIDVLSGILAADYKIKAAINGEKALKVAAIEPLPDLILLDIMMPDMDGYEVCQRLKASDKTRDIPVIFVTAMGEVENEEKGFALGGVDYITKPVQPSLVKARVKTHIELKQAREELQQQNAILQENIKLRDDVERMTNHDLKGPLNAVLNVPQLMIKTKKLDDEQVGMLKMVEEAGFRMLDIINSSLDLYKIETGRYQLAPVPVDILEIVKQIHGETRELVQTKNLTIQITVNGRGESKGDTFMVRGEKMLCHSMLANLIKNAVEASPNNEVIRISLDDREEGGQVTIHNKGMVPGEIADRFFEKYATSGKEGGTGLGTYTAKLMAETLGGSINYESFKKLGTVINVTLPKVGRPATAERAVPKAASVINDLRVLIVDDYIPMRQTIKAILRQVGIVEIFGASDGSDALQIIDEEPMDLIISDLNMPRVNGFELLRNIRSNPAWQELPFILVTGDASQDTVVLAASTKVSGFIIKPFSADLLIRKVENVLGLRLKDQV